MTNILIIEDEPLIRTAIKTLGNWESDGLSIKYEAQNGKKGLELLAKNNDISIVLVDINMPVLNGIEFIKRAKQQGFKGTIIVLSAYNEYNLVRQAFTLGCNDYIIKTDLNYGYILKILNGFINKKPAYLQEYANPHGHFDEKNHVKNSADESYMVSIVVLIDNFKAIKQRDPSGEVSYIKEVVLSTISEAVKKHRNKCFAVNNSEYVIVIWFKIVSISGVLTEISRIINRARQNLFNYAGINVSIGVSNVVTTEKSEVDLQNEAHENAQLRFLYGSNRTFYPENQFIDTVKNNSLIDADWELLAKAITDLNQKEAYRILNAITDEHLLRGLNVKSIKDHYARIVFIIMKSLYELNQSSIEIFGRDINFYDELERFDTMKEANIWLKNLLDWTFEYIKTNSNDKDCDIIAKACNFINKNYSQDISLLIVSEYVGVNESYLSHLFSKQTGETFVKYLTKVRMNEAKRIITSTNHKLYKVSEMVGYVNFEHFSRTFKKYTGYSPSQFKDIIH